MLTRVVVIGKTIAVKNCVVGPVGSRDRLIKAVMEVKTLLGITVNLDSANGSDVNKVGLLANYCFIITRSVYVLVQQRLTRIFLGALIAIEETKLITSQIADGLVIVTITVAAGPLNDTYCAFCIDCPWRTLQKSID